jgi:hypothetical protein
MCPHQYSPNHSSDVECIQGGIVDLGSYYESQLQNLEQLKAINPMIGSQQQKTVRNISQISFGDNYYFGGRHMYSSTMKETFSPDRNQSSSIRDVLRISTSPDSSERNQFESKVSSPELHASCPL